MRAVGLAVGAFAMGFLTFGLSWGETYPDLDAIAPSEVGHIAALMALDLLGGLLADVTLPVVLISPAPRRRAGLSAVLIVGLLAVSSAAAPSATVAIVAVGAWQHRSWLVALNATGVASAIVAGLTSPDREPFPVLLLSMAIGLALPSLLGLYLGSRRALIALYREQAASAAREQSAKVAQARAQERTARARDMHDTLSHQLALISLHAGALGFRDDLDRTQIGTSARLIQAAAQRAAQDLHTLLAVLRTETHDERPTPGICEVEHLVRDFHDRGVAVNLTLSDQARPRLADLPVPQSLALAHAVSEGIANAAKHAPGAPVNVVVAVDDEGVTARLSNPVGGIDSGLAGGFGLIGLQERLTLVGGHLRAGRRGTQFTLESWVPWTL